MGAEKILNLREYTPEALQNLQPRFIEKITSLLKPRQKKVPHVSSTP